MPRMFCARADKMPCTVCGRDCNATALPPNAFPCSLPCLLYSHHRRAARQWSKRQRRPGGGSDRRLLGQCEADRRSGGRGKGGERAACWHQLSCLPHASASRFCAFSGHGGLLGRLQRRLCRWCAAAGTLKITHQHPSAPCSATFCFAAHVQVVCHQLGKKGGIGRTYAYYGPGKQGLMVDALLCDTGMEGNLAACAVGLNWNFEVQDMARVYDWGVECTDPAGGGERFSWRSYKADVCMHAWLAGDAPDPVAVSWRCRPKGTGAPCVWLNTRTLAPWCSSPAGLQRPAQQPLLLLLHHEGRIHCLCGARRRCLPGEGRLVPPCVRLHWRALVHRPGAMSLAPGPIAPLTPHVPADRPTTGPSSRARNSCTTAPLIKARAAVFT